MANPIELIVGLANPGPQYAKTRHNAGAWFVEQLALSAHQTLRPEAKFQGLFTQINIGGQTCRLLIPTTFMNHSGQAVAAVANFYKLAPSAILIAHDELDLPAGTIRLKKDGGHGGHNGLRDIINHLHTKQFNRLRIGIGHPGHKDKVHDYVLSQPSKQDEAKISQGIDEISHHIDDIISGDIAKAMNQLHSNKD